VRKRYFPQTFTLTLFQGGGKHPDVQTDARVRMPVPVPHFPPLHPVRPRGGPHHPNRTWCSPDRNHAETARRSCRCQYPVSCAYMQCAHTGAAPPGPYAPLAQSKTHRDYSTLMPRTVSTCLQAGTACASYGFQCPSSYSKRLRQVVPL
jgi:hypothetical protein